MRRAGLLVGLLALALVLPGTASARVIELGKIDNAKRPSCPASCQAIGHVTGYQGRSGALRNPFVIKRAGYIVAFTVRLGSPDSRQRAFFNDLYGGPPRVRLAILRRGRTLATRRIHRLVRHSPSFRVGPYFGSTPTFVLQNPLRVRRTHRVALTVPTWAPVLSHGLPSTFWWRASRRRGTCDNVSQVAHHRRRNRRLYQCDYFTARLTYSATYVPDPRRTG
jgi:hypothetical protein